MKRKIFSLAIMAACVGSLAMGCSSTKKANGSDSTSVSDSNKMKAPMDTPSNGGVDTTKKDTVKKP